ncbi:helix-turn-helix domain-containing protein [Micromonospora narathiwatensis]|uniref:Winged helix-turn helix n=1 Tax=Micromonospora narathiwatensis TaxID=299146 RepID=A0A1A8ZHR0_9ACTN|nr:helix-turn-helix domain-containing protein [Micromonospora narathiwatensis]SBT43405.1 Winged helix-turn helix [Micromonospora narathiwatensis]
MGQPTQGRSFAISPEDREILVRLSRGHRRGGEPLRAAIVLAAATGLSYAETARRLATTRPTVATWLRRYAEEGVPGLRDRVRPGRRPRVRDADVVLRTLTAVPPVGGTWSSRALGVDLGLSNGTVARIWRRWGLCPAELAAFRLPGLPDLALADARLVGVHCDYRDCLLALAEGTGGGTADGGADRPAIGSPVGGPGDPLSGSPPDLADFLAAVTERRPGVRLHVLAAGAETTRRPAVRAWAARHGHLVRVAPPEPTWTELAAVAAGVTAPVAGPAAVDLGGALVSALGAAWRAAWFRDL